MTTSAFETYLAKVEADYRHGIATEHTYRSTLEALIETLLPGTDASNDPKHIDCGAPDFVVEKGKVPLGYVETKDVGVDLDKIEKTDQMRRYLKALNNLILTDYLEFRWYVNGERKRKVRIVEIGKNNRLMVNPQAATVIEQLFRDFYATEAPTVTTPKELASRLAGVTHFIRDQIIAALTSGDAALQKALGGRYTAFRELLLPALKPEEFADLYAQAMTYGLFAAKLSAPEGEHFTLTGAYQYLFGNKFLRRLFSDVSEELDEIDIIRPYLQDIVSLLNRANYAQILSEFGRRTRTEDPVVHFYETFLAAYDPKLRQSRGVYYTPEPVVQFIVHSVDRLLKTRFGKPWGLAEASVKVLDPATGTGTFLYYVIQQVYEEVVTNRQQAGQWPQKSKELLARLFGFELLIAPYVVSHLKLGLLLKTLGAPLTGRDERLHVYLTNTLEEGFANAERFAGAGFYLAEEGAEAAHIKKMEDIMVVLGNPPYSNFGMLNKSVWIADLLEDYKRGLHERKINLDDDFIKFIRFGQWRIEKTGHGILAFITNNTYIDGLTHRRMRQSLMEAFDEIYVLDLHGSSRKKEITPEGGKDENVFDIQQGVAILLAIKNPVGAGTSPAQAGRLPATVKHASLWGLRDEKYAFLQASDAGQVEWEQLQPQTPDFFFVPKDFGTQNEYSIGWGLADIFTTFQNGLKTDRDDLFFDYDRQTLEKRMVTFYSEAGLQSPFREEYNIEDSSSYDLLTRRKKTSFSANNICPCLYRPFDERWLYYSPGLTSRPAWDVMRHMLAGENIGLIVTRQTKEEWDIGITSTICGHKSCAAYDINSLFPLYLYTTPENTPGTFLAQLEPQKKANLNLTFVKDFGKKLGLAFVENGKGDLKVTFGPEDVFHYAYAVFHSPTYRSRYGEFLKIDFPRLPLTSNKKLFAALVKKGEELVSLHLLKSPKVDDFITSYSAVGNNVVEKVVFAPETSEVSKTSEVCGRVWINAAQYFGGVPQEVWEFKVGGYQVCEKWLKDRKGRLLSGEDITHYQRVVVALKETIRLMQEVDKSIPGWPVT